MSKSCDRPVRVPADGVSDRQARLLWTRDRVALAACGDQVEAITTSLGLKGE